MRILQVIPYFTPKMGGDVNYCYNLSSRLSKNGHEVVIATTNFLLEREYIESAENKGVRVVCFHNLTNVGLFLVSPAMKEWLRKCILDFDIIHLHSYRSYQNAVVHHYARNLAVPYVLQAHGSLPIVHRRRWLKTAFDIVWGNRILADASRVIALTHDEKLQYEKLGIEEAKIDVLPTGVDLEALAHLCARGEFRMKFGIGENDRVVLYVGRIHPTKGLDILLKAFAEASKSIKNLRLILVGPDDGYWRKLEELANQLAIRREMMYLGFVEEKDKMMAYVDADVFATPSYLGFPATFLEAAACGLPIVTTTRGDHLDWLEGKAGLVVEYDVSRLADALVRVLNERELRSRHGAMGRRIVEDRYSWEHLVTDFELHYSKAILSCRGTEK